MFDVGFQELVLIFVIGLLVLGPQRLPKVAAEIGKWVGRARRTAMQLRRQLEHEIELNEVVMPPKPPPRPASEEPPPAEDTAGETEKPSEEPSEASSENADASTVSPEAASSTTGKPPPQR